MKKLPLILAFTLLCFVGASACACLPIDTPVRTVGRDTAGSGIDFEAGDSIGMNF